MEYSDGSYTYSLSETLSDYSTSYESDNTEYISDSSISESDNIKIKRARIIPRSKNNPLTRSQPTGKYKWTTLEHNGVLFPPKYKKHNIPLIYAGEKIVLDEVAEEYATIYARYADTEYITSGRFNKNFWKDWRKILGKNSPIKNFNECDFSLIYKYVIEEKGKRLSMTKEQKEKEKDIRDKMEDKYKTAYVDGHEEQVGNFRIEPPGLFIGRGCHPKLGSIKKRFYPEDITINIGKDAKIPTPSIRNNDHEWGKIIHDRNVEWLASWIENVTGKRKYVWLASHSKLKAESDKKKFDLARKLKKNVGKIRTSIERELQHNEETIRQVSTALYLIDNFALRVGNEKGDDAADTVGVTSLRVEHIIFQDNNHITLDFLGKDSIRYKHTHKVDPRVYNNLKSFTTGKDKGEQLFNKIDSQFINRYLQSYMKDLTAKVFRTYNASNLLQKELNKITKKVGELSDSGDENVDNNFNMILDLFNKANLKVAILCNHQKKVAKSFNSQIDRFNERTNNIRAKIDGIQKLQAKRVRHGKKKSKRDTERIKKLREQIKEINAKKKTKIELKSVSLDTSKANYIDPRIVVAFSKKHHLPLEKVYSNALMEKFAWAQSVDQTWKF
jgi:DNA topoisomerase-1